MVNLTVTDARRLGMCLKCGARPAVAEPGSFAPYCAKHHAEHAAKWTKAEKTK
jgi:hypothetical protein